MVAQLFKLITGIINLTFQSVWLNQVWFPPAVGSQHGVPRASLVHAHWQSQENPDHCQHYCHFTCGTSSASCHSARRRCPVRLVPLQVHPCLESKPVDESPDLNAQDGRTVDSLGTCGTKSSHTGSSAGFSIIILFSQASLMLSMSSVALKIARRM